jgi:predicted metal-binding membrane protein
MSDSARRTVLPRRDRFYILSALLGVTAIAWIYLIRMASMMDSMPMTAIGAMQIRPWSAQDFWLMFVMWAVMMVGMMVPTAIPMTLIYATVAKKAASQGTSLAPTGIFVTGYVLVWTAFSAVATLAQWGLDQASLLTPMMVSASPVLGAALLIVAGVYQMSPAKKACLDHCRTPAQFISQHWRPGAFGAFTIGTEHGAYCLGCCWALMGLLFFGGVMNLAWIAAITLFVLAEQILPFGARGGLIAGTAMLTVGLSLLVFQGSFLP